YTNFYLAVDVVDWPGTDKNQAIVLVARGNITGNPAALTGVIMNYDAAQYGENPTDRRQGQLQINLVTNDPPFETKTLASAEFTMQPGRPYRLVFKAVDSLYTGQIYDHQDLTRPLVTIYADDAIQGTQPGGGTDVLFLEGFKSGKCGVLAFSRQSTVGTADVTFDNYYAGQTDPDPAAGEALAHPVAGTPTVETRIPAERYKNFHDPAAGVSFTAKTFSTNAINASATKLRLNGMDFSSSLVLSPNGSTITGSLPGSHLAANTVYSAVIELEDVAGTKRSTNTFWFDTFSDSYLRSAAVKTIEAEEYNHNFGQYLADPIPVSGMTTNGEWINGSGVGYWELPGSKFTDYYDVLDFPESTWALEFRSTDGVGLSQGMYPEIQDLYETSTQPLRRSDNIRSQYGASNLLEFVVHRTQPGEWLNYTRSFAAGTYAAYLRVASFGASAVELYEVTGDPTLPDQTTNKLGNFVIPNLMARYNYRYIPLTDAGGAPAAITLSGTKTLRLQMAGTPDQDIRKLALNYLVLVPQPVRLFSAADVAGPYAPEAAAIIDTNAKQVIVPVGNGNRYFRLNNTTALKIVHTHQVGNTLRFTYE
ncbi:MAG TPA: hypothetical protein VN673_17675, partial [Clostridia bacterium]|nr:hypothetical protein [Clostridia bacterium]